jgi:histidine decarboxylase
MAAIVDSLLGAEDQERLDVLYDRIRHDAQTFIGYPCNPLFDYSPLFRFLSYAVNNVGDPFVPSNYHLNTHDFEREVLEEFCRLTRAAADSFWGYVTNGGTEGNMYGIFLGRELFSGRPRLLLGKTRTIRSARSCPACTCGTS